MQADSWGVSFGYHDGAGTWHDVATATRQAIRRTLGATDEGDRAWTGRETLTVTELSSASFDRPTTLCAEDGSSVEIAANQMLPGDLPFGYHRLRFDDGSSRPLIYAPESCPVSTRSPTWGWAVQLYAMRSRQSWGIGEFSDLAALTAWSAERGAGMCLINPLHAAAPTPRQQNSPYFPSSRIYRNPLALRIELVPGAGAMADVVEPLARQAHVLNTDRLIDRDAVFALKMAALHALWGRWNVTTPASEHTRFDQYCRSEGGPLVDFATFCAIAEVHGTPWMTWPAELRHRSAPGVARLREERSERVQFHCWLQWLIDEQLGSAAPGVDLMTDLAVGIDRGGADGWIWQDLYALDMSVGAPPDAFNTQGQNWGLPPFNHWKLSEAGYDPMIRTIRSALRHAQAVRIDHVMGLFRLYWIPDGASPADGCYVYIPFQDLLGIIAIEAHRACAYIVGEDLGTVEPYVRHELTKSRILSYKLRQFEEGPSAEFPATALAAVTTHDLPTIAGLWSRRDIDDQRSIGLVANQSGAESIRTSLSEWSAVPASFGDEAINDVVVGAYQDLAGAPCAIVTATLDDALTVYERPNMPGTVDEWPNWRLALPLALEDVLVDERVAAVAQALTRARRSPDSETASGSSDG